MTVALCEALGDSPRNRTESAQAHRIMNKGQRAYVEPHTCCERNAPFTVAMRINGRASAIPDRSVLASRRKAKKQMPTKPQAPKAIARKVEPSATEDRSS